MWMIISIVQFAMMYAYNYQVANSLWQILFVDETNAVINEYGY